MLLEVGRAHGQAAAQGHVRVGHREPRDVVVHERVHPDLPRAVGQDRGCVGARRGRRRRGSGDRRGQLRHMVVVGLHRHIPEDAVILEPLLAFEQRAQTEAIHPRSRRGLHRELEPGDLTGTDVRRRLRGDAIRARPAGGRRAGGTVAAEDARLVLSGIGAPGPEEGVAVPPERTGIKERHRGNGCPAGAEDRIPALPIEGGVRSSDPDGGGRRRGDRCPDAGRAERRRKPGGLRRCLTRGGRPGREAERREDQHGDEQTTQQSGPFPWRARSRGRW